MNMIFDWWIWSNDKIYGEIMLCIENYKIFIIMKFLMHQNIVLKCSWSILY
jgi:hypothetical protein